MHHHFSLSALAALVPLAAFAQGQQPCSTVNIILARGSLEAQGVGLLGNIAKNASTQIPGSIVTPLEYPAQLDPYPPSVAAGVTNMTALLNQQAQQCPGTKLVLMGYSQVGSHMSRKSCNQTDAVTYHRVRKCRLTPSVARRMAPTSTPQWRRPQWSVARVSRPLESFKVDDLLTQTT